MMAYENNNLINNGPFVDSSADIFEPSQVEGKLNTPSSQMHPGFLQQVNNCNNIMTPQQMNSFANLQMQMNAQDNFMNNNNINNNSNIAMNNMQATPMTANFFPQTTLVSSMVMQQPFFQASSMAQQQLQQQLQQQQQQRGIPNFISFNNNSATLNSLLNCPGNADVPKSVPDFQKSFFGSLEPLPVVEKPTADIVKSEPVKAASTPLPPRTGISKSKRLLPVDFQPTGNYVICGNKRKFFESKGNIRFREVCKRFLQEYVQAPTKIEKSAVVTKVVSILREDCPEGAFVSPQGGRWYAVSERTAREKVGTYFRDCLSDSYKSSAKNKIARRKIIKKTSASASSKDDTNFSDDASLESISFYDVDDLTPVPL